MSPKSTNYHELPMKSSNELSSSDSRINIITPNGPICLKVLIQILVGFFVDVLQVEKLSKA
jgi:hypothetical protein